MLIIARRISNFLQCRPLFILFFWVLSTITFFLMSVTFEMIPIEILADNNQTAGNEGIIYTDVYRDPRMLLPFLVIPAICLTIFSRSIPIIFSVSLSTFLTICIISFLSRLNSSFNVDPSFLLIILHVTTANAIFLRRCWDKYRRAPCSSTIIRLVLATVDKSLPMLLATSTCASVIPLVSILVEPSKAIIVATCIFVLCVIQNICTMTSILSVLLIRNTYNWFIPTFKLSFTRGLQAFVEEKLVYVAHLMCRIGQRLLASHVKIPLVFGYLVVILGYISLLILRAVEFVNNCIDTGKIECTYSRCYQSITLTLSLFVVPPVFFFAINRTQINTVISLIGFLFTLVSMELIREFLLDDIPVSPLQYIVASIIPADGAIRFCTAYRLSRKKNHQANVLDTTDTLFSQTTLTTICSTGSIGFLFFYFHQPKFLILLIILLIINWITVVMFYPSAIAMIGPVIFGKSRRESQLSETRSFNTDRFSSHLLVDNPADYTKKYSTANYYGGAAKQKRSYNVMITDSRRASMPVGIQKIAITNSTAPILKKRSWATGGCYSVDGVITMTPREALKLMRKEDSITSDNILIKELALI